MMKLKKKIPLIDQHNKSGFWGGKFGGNFIPETLKKPIEDLTTLFEKLRYDKQFLKQRDYYFKNYIGSPTSFIKLQNLSNHLGSAQIYAKMVSGDGEVAEWSKAHAWKVCRLAIVSRVRIPVSPPARLHPDNRQV